MSDSLSMASTAEGPSWRHQEAQPPHRVRSRTRPRRLEELSEARQGVLRSIIAL